LSRQKTLERFANLFPSYFKPCPGLGEGLFLIPIPNEYRQACFDTNYDNLDTTEKNINLDIIRSFGCSIKSQDVFIDIEKFVTEKELENSKETINWWEKPQDKLKGKTNLFVIKTD
jgi:hypothetical protein